MNLHLFDTLSIYNTCFEVESTSHDLSNIFEIFLETNSQTPRSFFASNSSTANCQLPIFSPKSVKTSSLKKIDKGGSLKRGTRKKEPIATSVAAVLAVWLIVIMVRVCEGCNFHTNGNGKEANGSTTTGTRWPSMKQLWRTNGAQGVGVPMCTDAGLYPVGEDSRQISGNLSRSWTRLRRTYWQEARDNGP